MAEMSMPAARSMLTTLALVPRTADLQDRRARQPTMGEEQPLAEAGLAVVHLSINRQARQHLAAFEEIRLECQRHQRRPQLGHLEAELPRPIIALAGHPDFGYRQPAGGDHQ